VIVNAPDAGSVPAWRFTSARTDRLAKAARLPRCLEASSVYDSDTLGVRAYRYVRANISSRTFMHSSGASQAHRGSSIFGVAAPDTEGAHMSAGQAPFAGSWVTVPSGLT
jgi:hypothetical protein